MGKCFKLFLGDKGVNFASLAITGPAQTPTMIRSLVKSVEACHPQITDTTKEDLNAARYNRKQGSRKSGRDTLRRRW
jgi:hypothetical protein